MKNSPDEFPSNRANRIVEIVGKMLADAWKRERATVPLGETKETMPETDSEASLFQDPKPETD